MAKIKQHNEWFRTISKTTCDCGERRAHVWSWGEYHHAKWRTIAHFCEKCFDTRVKQSLSNHLEGCGCHVTLIAYRGGTLPAWLNLDHCPIITANA